jgi:hypothetical protein
MGPKTLSFHSVTADPHCGAITDTNQGQSNDVNDGVGGPMTALYCFRTNGLLSCTQSGDAFDWVASRFHKDS